MSIAREFFDWSEPALPQIVDWLCRQNVRGGIVDLSDVILVVPGGQAGRRLLDLLTQKTAGRNHLPMVITPEQLPEQLYEPQRPFASPLTQRLAWAEALRGLAPASLGALLQNPPQPDETDRWLELGTLLSRHHCELAADGLDFGDVASAGAQLPGFEEHDRWTVLREAQERYLALLDGLQLWDRQTARLVAIERRECSTNRRILLLAAVDLPRTHRLMLDQAADWVTALIHAPAELADHFDSHGCLLPEVWRDAHIDLSSDRVRVVDGPAEQAAEAAYAIADLNGRYNASQITIGVCDDALVPYLQRTLADCGLSSRSVQEKTAPQTAPVRLLAAVADYLDQERIEAFAALVRHPDVAGWLATQGCDPGWLEECDGYASMHLQPRLAEWLGRADETARLREAVTLVRSWLGALKSPDRRPLTDWSAPLTNLLLTIYRHVEFDEAVAPHRQSLAACEAIQAELAEQALVPPSLAGELTAADSIRLVLDALSSELIPPPPDPAAIPLVGWLELPLDDSPAAIVTTFNEDFVPSSVNADLFLPNGLRSRLGILDNARRYARDAYALCSLLNSRERLTLVVGRRTAEGNPLKPSRLLFAAEPETIAERVVQFYRPGETASAARPSLPSRLTTLRDQADFPIPRPRTLAAAVDEAPSLPVTAFKSYIACPYRYYLSYELGLTAADDSAEELDGAAFGELIHDVLKAFGQSDLKTCTEPAELRSFLDDQLDRLAQRKFGTLRRPAVRLQVEQLRQRLHAFAVRQTELVELGWETRHVEDSLDQPVYLHLGDGRKVRLEGRIDRIDFNPRLGIWRIIDYKTSARGESPDEIHRRKGDWIDLQLPLYRHLARQLTGSGDVQLGYFLLPQDSERTRIELAEWSVAELEQADELAQSIAGKILDQQFWPPSDDIRWSDWDAICQVGAFDREALEEPLP